MMTREGDPTDRRRVRLAVTPRGLRILEASRRGTLAYLAEKLNDVAADDRAVIVKAMEVLRSVFTNDTQAKAVVK
jgi:DNA-binding MarR family transcriptional regulator